MGHIQESNETNNITRVPISLTTLPPAGFMVLSASPTGAQSTPVSYVEFNFNQTVDPASFTTSAVSVNGPNGAIPVDSITQVNTVTSDIRCNSLGLSGTTLVVAHQTTKIGMPTGIFMRLFRSGKALFPKATAH